MKQTKTTLKELTAAYRAVLRHGILCNAIALGLIATAPAMAETITERQVLEEDTVLNSTVASGIVNNKVGGVFWSGRQLTINDGTFENNQSGAAAVLYDGSLEAYGNGESHSVTINDSTITGNQAGDFGAVAIFSPGSSVTNTTFTNNHATADYANLGDGAGALFLGSESQTVVTDSTFTENTSGTIGGAIATRPINYWLETSYSGKGTNSSVGGKMDVVSSTFTGNEAGTRGGAIFNSFYNSENHAGSAYVGDSTFTENSADKGGAVFNEGWQDAAGNYANLYIEDSAFEGNTATTNGGAVYNESTMTISETSFTNNTATGAYTPNGAGEATYVNGKGGAIYNQGNLTVGGTFENNTGFHGGAIYNTGTLTVSKGSTFDNNYANVEGGAIANTGTLTIGNDVIFKNNEAAIKAGDLDVATGGSNMGAGIYSEGRADSTKTVTIGNNVKFTGNSSEGGALYFYGANDVTIGNNIEFSGNTGVNSAALRAANASGSNGYASITIGDNALFKDNESVYASAIMSGTGSSINIGKNAVFSDNVGTAIRNNGTITFGANAMFSGNESTSTNEAGALRNTGIATFDSASFINNKTNTQGGAIYNKSGATLNLNASSGDVSFFGNTANGADNDIYNAGTINMNAADDTVISLAGGIDGASGTLNITGEGLVDISNSLNGQTVTVSRGQLHLSDPMTLTDTTIVVQNPAALNTQDNAINDYASKITLADGAGLLADANATGIDTFNITSGDTINLSGLRMLSDLDGTYADRNLAAAGNINFDGNKIYTSNYEYGVVGNTENNGQIRINRIGAGGLSAAINSTTSSDYQGVLYSVTDNDATVTTDAEIKKADVTLFGDGTGDGAKSVTLGANLSIDGDSSFVTENAKVEGTGSINNAEGGALGLNSSKIGVDVNNEGVAELVDSTFAAGNTFNNASGATTMLLNSEIYGTFRNFGIVHSDPTTVYGLYDNMGYTEFDADTFDTTAELRNTGTVDLKNDVTFASGATITGDGVINMLSGTTHFNNTASSNALMLASGAKFDGTLASTGVLDTRNSNIETSGDLGTVTGGDLYVDANLISGAIDTFAATTGANVKGIKLANTGYGTSNKVELDFGGATLDSNLEIEGMNYFTSVSKDGDKIVFSDKLINESGLDTKLGSWTDGNYIKSNTDMNTAADSDHLTVGDALTALDTQVKTNADAISDINASDPMTSGITAAKVSGYDAHIADADIHVTASEKATWSGKQDALTSDQLAAANSGITAAKVGTYDDVAAAVNDATTGLAATKAIADSAIQGVKVNGVALTPGTGNVVDITMTETANAGALHTAIDGIMSGTDSAKDKRTALAGLLTTGTYANQNLTSASTAEAVANYMQLTADVMSEYDFGWDLNAGLQHDLDGEGHYKIDVLNDAGVTNHTVAGAINANTAAIETNASNIADIVSGATIVAKAYGDEDGNNIKATYATKEEVTTGVTAVYNQAHNWAENLLGLDVDENVEDQLQHGLAALGGTNNIAATTVTGALHELDAEKAGLGTNNTFTGTNTFEGLLTANGGIATTTLAASGDASVGGDLSVTGDTTLGGSLKFAGTATANAIDNGSEAQTTGGANTLATVATVLASAGNATYTGAQVNGATTATTLKNALAATNAQVDTNTAAIGDVDYSDEAPSATTSFLAVSGGTTTVRGALDALDAGLSAHEDTLGDMTALSGAHVSATNTVAQNLDQLSMAVDAAADSAVATARTYTDQRVESLDKNLSAGVAGAVALSSVAVSGVERGEVSVGAGYGYFNGQSAAAFGAAMGLTNRWSINAGAGISNADVSFRAGTNYKFKLF